MNDWITALLFTVAPLSWRRLYSLWYTFRRHWVYYYSFVIYFLYFFLPSFSQLFMSWFHVITLLHFLLELHLSYYLCSMSSSVSVVALLWFVSGISPGLCSLLLSLLVLERRTKISFTDGLLSRWTTRLSKRRCFQHFSLFHKSLSVLGKNWSSV